MFPRLIRDADKLDIYYVVTNYYEQYVRDPDGFKLELELPDIPECSQHVVDATLKGKKIDHSELRTLNDMKILQLGWVYDVNFPATLKRIKQRKFLEKIIDFLPKTENIEKIKTKVFEYVNSRIEQN